MGWEGERKMYRGIKELGHPQCSNNVGIKAELASLWWTISIGGMSNKEDLGCADLRFEDHP